MAYIPSECTLNEYEEQIYSGYSLHRLYIKHGNTVIGNEAEDFASPFASSVTIKRRLIDNGSKTFNLDNFVAQEIEIKLHDYLVEDMSEEWEVKIGTYIDSKAKWVYVPIGKYILQEVPTTDKGVTTYKLKDKAMNFDFNYNAQEIIEEKGGSATLLQILDDICSKANVTYVGSRSFANLSNKIGIYDNSISARVYVSYIAELCGCIATIDRTGNLTFIEISNNLNTRIVSEDIVESFTNQQEYQISRVIFEDAVNYFVSGDETHDTLYLNAKNPYITSNEQVDAIYNKVNGLKINSFKTGKILGNPTIDPWDFISLTYEGNTYKTFAQYTLNFNGTMVATYDTNITLEAKQTNTTVLNSEIAYKKSLERTIDNVNASLSLVASEIGLGEDNSLKNQVSQLQLDKDGLEIRIQKAEENQDTQQKTIEDMKASFTTAGLTITSENSKIISLLNNKGLMLYKDSIDSGNNNLIAIFNHNGSGINKLIVTQSVQFQNLLGYKREINSKIKGNIPVISFFWNNNLIEELKDLVEEGN